MEGTCRGVIKGTISAFAESSGSQSVVCEPPGVRGTLQEVRENTVHNSCCFNYDRH
jgi:hypothetical protein